MTYRERASGAVAGAVVWTRADGGDPVRVLPDGCVDLIWTDGRLVVAGPDTRAHLVPAAVPGARHTGLRFAPGTGPGLLGVPAHELRDLRVPLEDLWPGRRARAVARRMAEAGAPGRVLEEAVGAAPPDPWTAEVVASAGRGEPVSALAARLAISERQLHRRALRSFGYGPKTLARVLRMRRAVRLARRGLAFAEVAAVCGYADQAHLAREVRALAGVPLGALTR
ncbi:helix-turn-helix transcriptional regulator [Streptomyces caatingaensis]|uniref:AraC family transcriptional regulator n=1 Tax=Streptomyces caatingaensis TaxID=1678637 RepID=A0A0K9XGU4_9ACTN|nr:helix-turn-helix transcriptional regulator [Streptomyces caatingaensis]KNB51897.1 AraC family transcriptional regulator [Streptomyces caatingaensis]